jgi:hypothetical protein
MMELPGMNSSAVLQVVFEPENPTSGSGHDVKGHKLSTQRTTYVFAGLLMARKTSTGEIEFIISVSTNWNLVRRLQNGNLKRTAGATIAS